jgi:hypothetical protein
MKNQNKKRVIEALIGMLQTQLETGTGESFTVFCTDLIDGEGDNFIQNGAQLDIVDQIDGLVTEISFQLSDDSEEEEEY